MTNRTTILWHLARLLFWRKKTEFTLPAGVVSALVPLPCEMPPCHKNAIQRNFAGIALVKYNAGQVLRQKNDIPSLSEAG